MKAPSETQLLSKPKSIPFYLIQSIFHHCSLQQSRTNATYPYSRRKKDIHDGEKMSNPPKELDQNLYLHKSKGQHLLTNPRVIDTIVRKSRINPTDTVLEIGPGTGNLTLRLLELAKKVVAVEIDKRMVEILNKRVSESGFEDKLEIINEDALKAKFPHFDLVVANIPYGISSPLVTKLVYGENIYRSITLLLQKEFARRLLANPGDSEYNRLAVNVKLVANVEFVMDVSKRDFLPPPKVDSSVVIIHPKLQFPIVDLHEWRAFTRTCFGNKNKTLGAIFKQKKKVIELLRISKIKSPSSENYVSANEEEEEEEEEVEEESSCLEIELSSYKKRISEALKANDFDSKRPSKLCNEELLKLLYLFNQAGVYFHAQKK